MQASEISRKCTKCGVYDGDIRDYLVIIVIEIQ